MQKTTQPTYHTIGSKYLETQDLDLTDIAKLVRSDLKELVSEFEGAKLSVRVQRYSMGQTLHVELSNSGIDRRSSFGMSIANKIKGTIEDYNFNDSDSMSDYYHVRFHSSVRIES